MPKVSIITPTTGKESLFRLIDSIRQQKDLEPVEHILLWDDFREDSFAGEGNWVVNPKALEEGHYSNNDNYLIKSIVIKGNMVQGEAKGSALRAIGLMISQGDFVTFADDDVIWEENHLSTMLSSIQGKKWAFCKRQIWNDLGDGDFEYLGVDSFESVGEEAKTPYKMVDNNCMMFERRLGTSAAVIYRETKEYNDDRLMYDFLKKYAGEPGKTNLVTINQVCPKKLIDFFRLNCTK